MSLVSQMWESVGQSVLLFAYITNHRPQVLVSAKIPWSVIPMWAQWFVFACSAGPWALSFWLSHHGLCDLYPNPVRRVLPDTSHPFHR